MSDKFLFLFKSVYQKAIFSDIKFVTKKPSMIAIVSGEFTTLWLSAGWGTNAKPWQP
jgi:hypothetical protein